MRNQESTQVVESFKMSNILELNEQEKQILDQLKRIINEECEKLDNDISELQTQLLQTSRTQSTKAPNTKELKDFSNKL